MSKDAGPERKHFGGDKGLKTEVSGGKTRYFWRCNFCKHEIGDKSFPNAKARVHLSGDVTLKTGLISVLCPKAPSDVKEQFALLEKTRRLQRAAKQRSRKRGLELMQSSPALQTTTPKRCRQRKLLFPVTSNLPDEDVNDAWGRAFFGLDIAANKLADPLFREAIHATKKSRVGFVITVLLNC